MRRGWKHYGAGSVSKNPYYAEINDRIAVQSSRVQLAKWLGGFFLILGFGGIVFFHPTLRIRAVQITGVETVFVPQIQEAVTNILQQYRLKIFPNNHYLFYPEALLRNTIIQTIYAENISIKPQWGGVLAIDIQSYPTALFWKVGDTYYAINHQGFITEQIPKIDTIQDAVIIEDSGRSPQIGTLITTTEVVNWVLEANTAIKTHLNQSIQGVYLSLNHPEIVQIQIKQLLITLNREDPAEAQILRLKIFLGSKPPIMIDEKHTIDLRFKEKIYYR